MEQGPQIPPYPGQPGQYYQPYPQYPYTPAYSPPKKKGDPWMVMAVIAIVLLLLSNAYWIVQFTPGSAIGGDDDLEYLELVRIDSTTADYYQSLREEVGPQSASWSYYASDWQDDVDFCANLAKHDIGKLYWEEWDSYYQDSKGTHAYNDALVKMTDILILAGVDSSDDDITNMAAILSLISNKVTYASDIEDKFFAPVETLSYGSGDCDDFSILAAALFELVGVDSAVAFFNNDQGEGHAMTLVHLDSLDGYRYYYYSDLTDLGLDAGDWIIIEPQSLISDQDDSQWIEQWNIEVAAEI